MSFPNRNTSPPPPPPRSSSPSGRPTLPSIRSLLHEVEPLGGRVSSSGHYPRAVPGSSPGAMGSPVAYQPLRGSFTQQVLLSPNQQSPPPPQNLPSPNSLPTSSAARPASSLPAGYGLGAPANPQRYGARASLPPSLNPQPLQGLPASSSSSYSSFPSLPPPSSAGRASPAPRPLPSFSSSAPPPTARPPFSHGPYRPTSPPPPLPVPVASTSSAALSHPPVTTLPKRFACPTCGMRFARKNDQQRHSRIHSSFSPFECDKCGQGFKRSDALRRHEAKGQC